jgi:hypothetical protein
VLQNIRLSGHENISDLNFLSIQSYFKNVLHRIKHTFFIHFFISLFFAIYLYIIKIIMMKNYNKIKEKIETMS